MTSYAFETFIFRKMNQSYWDEYNVKERVARMKSERVNQKMAEDDTPINNEYLKKI